MSRLSFKVSMRPAARPRPVRNIWWDTIFASCCAAILAMAAIALVVF